MKIEQSNVTMKACHEFSSECGSISSLKAVSKPVSDGISANRGNNGCRQKGRTGAITSDARRADRPHSGLHLRQQPSTSHGCSGNTENGRPPQPEQGNAPANRTNGLEKRIHGNHPREHESSSFSSTGEIKTAKRPFARFQLELSMCRDFSCERKIEDSGTIALRDPLIINFRRQDRRNFRQALLL